MIQRTPPIRESFEETVTVDFVRLTTGGSFSDARYILTVSKDNKWWLVDGAKVTPYDCLLTVFATESGQDDDVVFER